MNYKKINTGLDLFYTIGLAIIFIIAGFYIHNILYNVVSISYGIWISYLWLHEHGNKLIEKEGINKISDNNSASVNTPTITNSAYPT